MLKDSLAQGRVSDKETAIHLSNSKLIVDNSIIQSNIGTEPAGSTIRILKLSHFEATNVTWLDNKA